MVRIGYEKAKDHKGGFTIMAAAGNVQIMYGCESCKEASDSQGRGCKCGLMFPILLLLNGMTSCPNYEKDIEKINKSTENYD